MADDFVQDCTIDGAHLFMVEVIGPYQSAWVHARWCLWCGCGVMHEHGRPDPPAAPM